MRTTPLHVTGIVAATLLVVPAAFAQDAYDDAFLHADERASAGDLDAAARALELVLPLYPQDYALPLQIAWMHYRAGRFDAAERFYRIAVERSRGAAEARLGLAASIERQGRCAEATPLYEGVAAERPDLAAAREGLARCAPPPGWTVTPDVSLQGAIFPGHPYKSLAGGATGGIAFAHGNGFFFAASYRYTRFAPATGAALSAWDQHEGYATLGYAAKAGAFLAHYAAVYDGSGLYGLSHHAGISARWSPFGDIELEGAASFYSDIKVFRAALSWRIPIAVGISIRPGVAVQDSGGRVHVTGMGTLAWDSRWVSLWAGGKYGNEERPVYWGVPVVYDTPELIPYGAWAGIGVNASEAVRIHLAYSMDRLTQADGTASSAHALSLGVAASF
jgi:tetratricopeptide (TPR) repeat protein